MHAHDQLLAQSSAQRTHAQNMEKFDSQFPVLTSAKGTCCSHSYAACVLEICFIFIYNPISSVASSRSRLLSTCLSAVFLRHGVFLSSMFEQEMCLRRRN